MKLWIIKIQKYSMPILNLIQIILKKIIYLSESSNEQEINKSSEKDKEININVENKTTKKMIYNFYQMKIKFKIWIK